MQDFILKELVVENIESELEKIGFDIAYRAKASEKFQYKTFKIFDLTLPQANILKQTALSFGADCGVHREVLTSKIDKTDAILGGSYSQLRKIADKLKQQPFSLKYLAEAILNQLNREERKTKIVGILNITPDSFSDGGKYFDSESVVKQFYKLIDEGADMIDIGAESTKPNSQAVPPEEQIERLKLLLGCITDVPVPLSVDTRSSIVAEFALDNGVSLINDVSGLDFDSKMLDLLSRYKAGVVIQHSTENAQDRPVYNDVVEEVYLSLLNKAKLARENGINNIILDPGIGFGKSKEQNFELISRFKEFYSLDYPIMFGISRKSFLGIKENDNNLKDALSLAVSTPLILSGVDYLRVHNVKMHKQFIKTLP